jgi:hypothetical protein
MFSEDIEARLRERGHRGEGITERASRRGNEGEDTMMRT